MSGAASPARIADGNECILFRALAGRATWRLPGKQGVAVVEVTGTIMSEDMAFVLAMVRLGRGIALLPGEVARTVVPRGELVRLFPDYGIGGAMLSSLTPSAAFLPWRVALLRDVLVERLPRELLS